MNNTDQRSSSAVARCCVCSEATLREVDVYRSLRRVTSDCRPWPAGGRLFACPRCGCVQNAADEVFLREIDEIYRSYAIYSQGEGAEQSVYNQHSGAASPRSVSLLQRLLKEFPLPQTGRMLDVGCGNGATLRAFRHARPRWKLSGTELNGKYRSQVEEITGAGGFSDRAPHEIPGEFDLISMIHVLEHVTNPSEFLSAVRAKLSPAGLLLVELPSYQHNAFELLIADHRTHFSQTSIRSLLERTGYQIDMIAEDWVPKELTVVARVNSRTVCPNPTPDLTASSSAPEVSISWLRALLETAHDLAASGPIGVFGTSIAATWLFSELADSVSFFVDEDPNRAGREYFGRPIFRPSEIPDGARVFVPLPMPMARNVAQRLKAPGVLYLTPPGIDLRARPIDSKQ